MEPFPLTHPASVRGSSKTTKENWLLRCSLLLGLFLIVWLWILPIRNSFWLDETLTLQLLQTELSATIRDTALYSQSPLFSLIEWIIVRVTGSDGEIALRAVSLLAGIGTLCFWYRIGKELIDWEFGLMLVGLYIVLPQVAAEVPDARPYSLALLAETSGLFFFLRWMKSRASKDAFFWTICSAFAVHLQFLFGVALAIEVLFALFFEYRNRFEHARQLFGCLVVFIVLIAPAAPQFLMLFRERKLLAFPDKPRILDLALQIFPAACAVVAPVALIAAVRERRAHLKNVDIRFVLACTLLLVPTVGFFILSRVGSTVLFKPRYLLPATPGLVLVWGWIVRSIQPKGVRRSTAVVAILFMAALTSRLSLIPEYHDDNWRAVMAAVPESSGILLYNGLVETRRLDWLDDSDHWRYLTGPVQAYRKTVHRTDILLVPFEFDRPAQRYIETSLPRFSAGRSNISLVIRNYPNGPKWLSFLTRRVQDEGFREVRRSHSGSIWTIVLSR